MPDVGTPQLRSARNPFDAATSSSSSGTQLVIYLSPLGTDDGAQIIAACNTLNGLGGGVLVLGGGDFKIYTVGTAYTVLGAFSACKGLKLVCYGARLVVDPARLFAVSYAALFTFADCINTTCDEFDAIGTGTAADTNNATFLGLILFQFNTGNVNVNLPNNKVVGMTALNFYNQDGSGNAVGPPTRNVTIGNLDCTNSYYGIACQFGPDNMTIAALNTNTTHRSLIGYGLRGLRANIFSENPKAEDVLIGPHSQRPFLEDVEVNYSSVASTAATDSAVRVDLRLAWGLTALGAIVAQTVKNVKIHYNLVYLAGQQSGAEAFRMEKYSDGVGTPDVLDRGHVLENLEISGRIIGTPHAFVNILGTLSTCAWGAGDFWRNIKLKDLNISSGNGAASLNLGALSGPMLVENVVTDTAVNLWSVVSTSRVQVGQLKIVNCQIPNLYSTVGGANPLLIFQAGAVSFSLPVGWSGMVMTNALAAGGDVVETLPAAVPGLTYTFLRIDAGAYKIPPNGAETIRGGAAGQQLWFDTTPGGGATLTCLTAGFWEVTGVNGAISFH